MKEFLKTNTVTYNLMSFTAFKSILLFILLIESPKSYEEMQNFFKNHEYLHECISIDTLRIYLNSLKEIGCEISKKTLDGTTRYWINSHPLALKFDEKQIKIKLKVKFDFLFFIVEFSLLLFSAEILLSAELTVEVFLEINYSLTLILLFVTKAIITPTISTPPMM